MSQAKVIGAAIGIGAQDTRCESGPDTLHEAGIVEALQAEGMAIDWEKILYTRRDPARSKLNQVSGFNTRLARAVCEVKAAGNFPVVLGGDHSCAIGTWSGVFAAHVCHPLGLIWIDAHLDSHTFETTPSQAIHGMPLAALLGYGNPDLTGIMTSKAKLYPENVCLIGIRSYEPGELELITRLGVRVYYMDEIRQRGMAAVVQEAVEHVSRHTACYGLSIDLDCMDPVDAPGVGSPEPGGILANELMESLAFIRNDNRFTALEITEYNPDLDVDLATAKLVGHLLQVLIPSSLQQSDASPPSNASFTP